MLCNPIQLRLQIFGLYLNTQTQIYFHTLSLPFHLAARSSVQLRKKESRAFERGLVMTYISPSVVLARLNHHPSPLSFSVGGGVHQRVSHKLRGSSRQAGGNVEGAAGWNTKTNAQVHRWMDGWMDGCLMEWLRFQPLRHQATHVWCCLLSSS